MSRVRMSSVVVAVLMVVAVVPLIADDVKTRLSPYEETPVTLNSTARGNFSAKISEHGTMLEYELSYRNSPSPVTQAHIHFGRPGLSGGVVLFLCTNLGPPPGVPLPPPCPAAPATVTGVLSAADVIALPGQGIDAGAAGFEQILRAMRAGAAYVNVHTTGRPGGEIRGGLGPNHLGH